MPTAPVQPSPQLQQLDENRKNVLINQINKWRDAGADEQGNPLDPDGQQVVIDYRAATEGHYRGKEFIKPWMAPVEGVDIKSPLEIRESVSTRLNRYAKEAGTGAAHFSIGVAEGLNPLALPHTVELLARASQESADPNKGLFGRIVERLQKAEEKTVLPRMDVGQLAAGTRTAARAVGNLAQLEAPNLTKTFGEELENQRAFEQSANPLYSAAGSISSAIPGVIGMARSIPSAANTLGKGVRKLTGIGAAEKVIQSAGQMPIKDVNLISGSGDNLRKAQTLQAKLLGDAAPEISDAIRTRTENVEKLLNAGRNERSLLPEVEKLGGHLDATEQYLGQMVGDFRDFIREQNTVMVKTRGSVQKLSTIANELKAPSGESFMTPKDVALYNKYKNILKAPGVERTVSGIPGKEKNLFELDAATIQKTIDAIDSDLMPLYNGNVQTNNSRQFLIKLSDVRRSLKGELHEKFPAYAKADELFSEWKNTADGIRGKIASDNAEGFLSRLFNVDKDRTRKDLEVLVNQGKKAADAVKEMKEDAAFASKIVNSKANALVSDLKARVEELNFPEMNDFVNSIADKLAARKLKSIADSGQADFPADKIQRLINEYVSAKSAADISKIRKAAGAVGALTGGTTGSMLGLLLGEAAHVPFGTLGGAGSAGAIGAVKGYKTAGDIAEWALKGKVVNRATEQAKEFFTPFKVLELFKEARVPELNKVADDVNAVRKAFGDDSALKFMAIIPETPVMKAFMKVAAPQGVIQSLGIENGDVVQNLDFTNGSSVSPQKKQEKK